MITAQKKTFSNRNWNIISSPFVFFSPFRERERETNDNKRKCIHILFSHFVEEKLKIIMRPSYATEFSSLRWVTNTEYGGGIRVSILNRIKLHYFSTWCDAFLVSLLNSSPKLVSAVVMSQFLVGRSIKVLACSLCKRYDVFLDLSSSLQLHPDSFQQLVWLPSPKQDTTPHWLPIQQQQQGLQS